MYSRNKINKAGDKLVNGPGASEELSAAMDVLSYWRLCHEGSLESAFNLLQKVTREIDKEAIYARRLKRTASIILKLQRNDGRMMLSRMQDIGGCRAIISTNKKLTRLVRELKKQKEFKLESGGYRIRDYLAEPKKDGYRSLHIVGRFPDANGELRQIEIQVRTRIQHYWATAVEIVDLFTGQALKSNIGDPEWKKYFADVSEQFKLMEDVHIFSQLPRLKQYAEFRKILEKEEGRIEDCLSVKLQSKKLNVIQDFQAYANSLKIVDDQLSKFPASSYVLLKIDTGNRTVWSKFYESKDVASAEGDYIQSEKQTANEPGTVVALVSSAAVGGIKEAYPNYFADSSEFLQLLKIIESIEDPKHRKLFNKLFNIKN